MRYKKNYDLIVFDWDGTLFDSTRVITHCIQAAVQDVGGTRPTVQQAAYVIGLNLKEALAHVAPDVPVSQFALLAERYRHHFFLQQDNLHLFDGVLDLLFSLKEQDYRVVIATGKPRKGLDVTLSREVRRKDGQIIELATLFDDSRTADETQGKPDPQMLYELMQAFDVPAKRTLMVGDTTHDLQMAINAKVDAVGVSYGAHESDFLQTLNPLAICSSVSELKTWFEQ